MMGKCVEAIIAMRGRPKGGEAILSSKRTEYGKEIRKAYESHEVYEQRKNMQRLEPRTDGLTNTLTSVTKDNLLLTREDMEKERKAYISEDALLYLKNTPRSRYRIRKLTPRSCFRLMGVSDIDIDRIMYGHDSEWVGRAAEIESDTLTRIKFRVCDKHKWKQYRRMKRMQKISNSRLYALAGNSIVMPVLMALFSQLNILNVQLWNDMTEEQIEELIAKNR